MSQSAQALDNKQPPLHVGIIMDGNGRWAQKRGLARTAGHKEGLETAKKIVKACANAGIKYVTLYTFSTENWKRAQEEVGYLMGLIKGHLRAEFEFYKANGIRIEHLGDLKGLPEDVQTEIINAKEETKNFTGLTVVLAINYGGRDEIIRSVKKILNNQINSDSLTEKSISDNFDIPELPDVDFLIRTGGEKRLSNFLLWHSAYAELCFTDTLWPDYTEDELIENLNEFYKRTRRFGDVLVK
ncbi:MAG: polyprenyl diphosphate synthase [Treponema sp.]|uniref:polyprenyl diphosphate synthase n=1 Tax=Treponema sp. TaxID=166 RepID=UPI00298E7EB9|nr:polyprenyl diphosphate synthase [Treponema sp.]MCQ2600069.1 polyprenyl diphosphate synthase [Treponema sp.]